MKILVCVEQEPRRDGVRFSVGGNRVVRDGVAHMMNSTDEYATRARPGGQVTVATGHPPPARATMAVAGPDIAAEPLEVIAELHRHAAEPAGAS